LKSGGVDDTRVRVATSSNPGSARVLPVDSQQQSCPVVRCKSFNDLPMLKHKWSQLSEGLGIQRVANEEHHRRFRSAMQSGSLSNQES